MQSRNETRKQTSEKEQRDQIDSETRREHCRSVTSFLCTYRVKDHEQTAERRETPDEEDGHAIGGRVRAGEHIDPRIRAGRRARVRAQKDADDDERDERENEAERVLQSSKQQ